MFRGDDLVGVVILYKLRLSRSPISKLSWSQLLLIRR